jgi:hypothetical protein
MILGTGHTNQLVLKHQNDFAVPGRSAVKSPNGASNIKELTTTKNIEKSEWIQARFA